jgi:hypothetical protein
MVSFDISVLSSSHQQNQSPIISHCVYPSVIMGKFSLHTTFVVILILSLLVKLQSNSNLD